MCLQGMVDELIMKKEGRKMSRVTNYFSLYTVAALPPSLLVSNEVLWRRTIRKQRWKKKSKKNGTGLDTN